MRGAVERQRQGGEDRETDHDGQHAIFLDRHVAQQEGAAQGGRPRQR